MWQFIRVLCPEACTLLLSCQFERLHADCSHNNDTVFDLKQYKRQPDWGVSYCH